MAKKSSIEHNKYRKLLIQKYENQRKKLKLTVMDRQISTEKRLQASLKLAQLPRNSSSVRYRNRCYVTGRRNGVYSYFGLSRTPLRELASSGLIPGMVKSSW